MKLSDTAFTSLKKIARRHLGLDIRSIGRAVFESALTKRMDELELDFTEYFTCITGSEFEQKIFVQGFNKQNKNKMYVFIIRIRHYASINKSIQLVLYTCMNASNI